MINDSASAGASRNVAAGPARLAYLIKQVELAIRADLDRSVRQFGVTTLQYTALSVLDHQPGISSAQLARRSFVTAQAANVMVAALERKCLIERRATDRNRRILGVYLTAAGQAVLQACDDHANILEARMLAGMDKAARDGLRRGLESCAVSLRSRG